MKAVQFTNMVRRILREEVEKRSDTNTKTYERVPEVGTTEDLKKVAHEPDSRTKGQILDFITKAVKDISAEAKVVWDDHDDITVWATDMFKVRIIPRWENNYNIEAFIRNQDRIYITGQKLEQVKEFLKVNLKNAETNQDKAYKKSIDNVTGKNDKDNTPDKGLPQKDKPKTAPLTNEKPSETKNKDKNYTEKQTKEAKDLPNAPMREVGEFKKQTDHKVQDPVKLRKRKPDTKLTIKP